MFLQKRKRHSFSIESLAVSSHVEQQERDTESPYLDYLQTKNASVDVNANIVTKQWITDPYSLQGGNAQLQQPSTNSSLPQATSTPIQNGNKRRRLCSTTTPPSSDESQHVSDDWTQMSTSAFNLVIDESSNFSTNTRDKLSPTPSSTSESDHSGSGDSICRRKKSRTAFSGDQLRELERRYRTQKYLTASDRSALAVKLHLREQQVKTWFQNRRMKEKRQQREEEQCQTVSLPTGGVDIAQLTALGICPPTYAHQFGSASPLNHSFSASTTLPSDRLAQPGYPHMPNIGTSMDTLTAVHRPMPSKAHAQDRVSALTNLRQNDDRKIDMRSEGHFVTSPTRIPGVSDSLLMQSYPTNYLPNFHLPYAGSLVTSPYRV